MGIAAGAAMAATTVPRSSTIGIPLLWAIAGVGAAVAILCLLAHWDANRGRIPRHSEIVEEKTEGPDPGSGDF